MKLLKPVLGLLLLCCLAQDSLSQILNINPIDVTTDSSNYFSGGVNFFLETDNRSPTPEEEAYLLAIELGSNLVYVGKKNAYYLNGQLNHYEATGDPVISTGYIHFRTNFFRQKTVSYEAYSQFSFDAGRRLDYRGLAGGGIKYQFVKKKGVDIDLGTGLFYEHEKWETFDDISVVVSKSLMKTSSYFKSNLYMSESATLSFISFYQVGYDPAISAFRHRISADLYLQFEITQYFSFMVSGSIHYEDKPIIDINKTVYAISNGLAFSF